MKRKRAFTLIEVLVVLGIAGILVTAGVTPLFFTVRTLSTTRAQFAEEGRERAVFNRIALDLREIVTLNAPAPVKITKSDELEEAPRDCLILWTKTPTYAGEPLGSVIYAIPPETVLSGNFEEGLYRWIISRDIDPRTETSGIAELLDPEKGTLVLPGVTGISFKALNGAEWQSSYSGAMPMAIMAVFEYEDREKAYEALLPKG